MDIIILILVAAGAWFSAYHCRKMQRIYNEHAREVYGQVVSWEKKRRSSGRHMETCYDMEVLTPDGESYYISSTSRNARKYEHQRDIVLLVPEGVSGSVDNKILQELIMKELSGKITDEEAEKLSVFREIETARQQAEGVLADTSQRLTIIKEDNRYGRDLKISVVTGALLSALAVIWIILQICSHL